MMDFAVGNAQSIREMAVGTYKTEAALQALVIAAIYAAVASSAGSCTVSMTGTSAQDNQNVVRMLADMNFTTSQLGTTLTISW